MERRDYVLRLIERMRQVLARVRELILRGDFVAVNTELQALAKQTGVGLELAKSLSDESLLLLLSTDGEPDPTKCLVVAEVLYLDGVRAREQGAPEESRRSFRTSLRLFLVAHSRTPAAETREIAAKIEALVAALGTLPPALERAVSQYRESATARGRSP